MIIFIRKVPKAEAAGSAVGNILPTSLTAATHDAHPPLRIQDSDRTEYVPPVCNALSVYVGGGGGVGVFMWGEGEVWCVYIMRCLHRVPIDLSVEPPGYLPSLIEAFSFSNFAPKFVFI